MVGALVLLAGCATSEATTGDGDAGDPAATMTTPPTTSTMTPTMTPTTGGAVEVATITTAEGIRDIGFVRNGDGTVTFDGDIVLDERELEAARVDRKTHSAVTTVGSLRWPSGVVFYEIDPALPQQTRVTDAIAHWEANTPYRFFPRQGQASYIRFVPHATDCSSQVGRQSSGQVINLATGCGVGSTIHEIGHAIGLFHEQTRQDRDNYVTIHPECIEPGKEFNFSKYSTGTDVGPYDYMSIMHYPRFAFSTGCETITPRDPQAPAIGQRSTLSAGDILGAWRIFNGVRPNVHPVPADYDGDGKTDFAIKDDTGVWRIDYAANGFGTWDVVRSGYGGADALPVPADYDGDGKADLSVKTNDGTWYVDYASSPQDGWNVIRSGYGDNSGTPVPADYDGDGKADFSVKGCDGVWYVDYASSPQDGWNVIRSGYGDCSGVPVPADYDGDGKADFAIKGSDGVWYVDYASSPQDGWNVIRSGYGGTDVVPVPADYDGDGKADFSVKSNSGVWFIDYSSSPQDGWNVIVGGYGDASSIPVPGNYDGVDADGKRRADLSVKAVGDEGAWFVDRAATGFGAWDFYKPLGV